MKAWHNGSAFDSRSRGWGFKSLCLQSFFFFKELNQNSYEILAYADDLCILCKGINQLLNILNKIEKWSILNGINVNKKKSGIMILKGTDDRSEIEGYPIIKQYKYLGITIDNKMKINNHIGIIDKK